MQSLLESVRDQCPGLDPEAIDRHFRRMPAVYFDRHASADVARHLRLLARISTERPAAVALADLGSYENRGLLKPAASGEFVPISGRGEPASPTRADTQRYAPPAGPGATIV